VVMVMLGLEPTEFYVMDLPGFEFGRVYLKI
jgi:hypothetical protein